MAFNPEPWAKCNTFKKLLLIGVWSALDSNLNIEEYYLILVQESYYYYCEAQARVRQGWSRVGQ